MQENDARYQFRHLIRTVYPKDFKKNKKAKFFIYGGLVLLVLIFAFLPKSRPSTGEEIKIETLQENYEKSARIDPNSFELPKPYEMLEINWKDFQFRIPSFMRITLGRLNQNALMYAYQKEIGEFQIFSLYMLQTSSSGDLIDFVNQRLSEYGKVIIEKERILPSYIERKFKDEKSLSVYFLKAYKLIDKFYIFILSSDSGFYKENQKLLDLIYNSIEIN